MKTIILVNIGGKSHPDLLKNLTEKSLKLGAVWLNSKVNYLSGYISALIKIEVENSRVDDLKKLFTQSHGITANFYDSLFDTGSCKETLNLMVDAEDRPGIVNELIQLFHDRGIEVLNLDSHRLCAAGLGNIMFTADITLACPPELQHSDFTRELEALNIVVRVIDNVQAIAS